MRMEKILYYVWKHKIFPLSELRTTDGLPVEVINCGQPNIHAGPDFLQARIKIGDVMWAGNVEIHERSSDWFRHQHNTNKAYDNVILHIASVIDTKVTNSSGRDIPQMKLECPPHLLDRYRELSESLHYPACFSSVGQIPAIKIHGWLNSLCIERLSAKSERIEAYQQATNSDWENSLFIALARNFGFGVNGEAFELWAKNVPYGALGKHRDNLLQIEAIFFGQAGFLDENLLPKAYKDAIVNDEYFRRLATEYKFLSAKFGLKPIEPHLWKYLRMRPANFPHIRLAQLASLYNRGAISVSHILDAENTDALLKLLDGGVSTYWQTHCNFATLSENRQHKLSLSSRRLVVINTIVPLLYAYGKHLGNEAVCAKAIALLEELPAENNHIMRCWADCGIKVSQAADSQALLQLKTMYCDRKDCLRCRFGFEYLSGGKKG